MEKIAIIDNLDNITGYLEKSEVHEKGILHRAFSIFIFNNKWELLIQKRTKEKYHSGGLWTNSCCSHQKEKESIIEAAHRRMKEEIGIECPLRKVFSFKYSVKFDNGLKENEIDYVFLGISNKTPLLNKDEAEDFKWVKLNELKKDIKTNPSKYTYWFKKALPKINKEIIKMSKINQFGMATFAGIFNKDFSKVLMIKRNEEKRKKYGFDWAIVGGKIDFGEYSLDAIIREIKEEIGVEVSKENISLLYVKEDPNWNNLAHVAFFIYGAILDENSKIILNDEAEEYDWFDINNLPKNRSEDDIVKLRDLTKKIFDKKNKNLSK